MGETSIEWADYTFNPWSGCVKVSAGCTNCYAAALPPLMRRNARWGATEPRIVAGDDYWKQPLSWDRKARKDGVRRRVFCASTADVFEERQDLDPWRERLWKLIDDTPQLDWLLLTKRPHNAHRWSTNHQWPTNAWIGTSVENQEAASTRIPYLLDVPARIRFLSCEPLVGPLTLEDWLAPRADCACAGGGASDLAKICPKCGHRTGTYKPKIHWVIVGGESGPKARPIHPFWPVKLREECRNAGIPFFFKQWGKWRPPQIGEHFSYEHGKDQDIPTFLVEPTDGRLYTERIHGSQSPMMRVGRQKAGNILVDRTWEQVPE